ncbi:MAG: hypothetical protein ACTS73_06155 [Arsenophonus sp. NEOnobi-MAG3]
MHELIRNGARQLISHTVKAELKAHAATTCERRLLGGAVPMPYPP